MAERKYFCLNGPRQGEMITQSTDTKYFLFNRSSRIIRRESKWEYNRFPSAILIHIDTLPEEE